MKIKYLILALMVTNVYAAPVQLDWVPILEREDDTQMSIDEVGGFRVYEQGETVKIADVSDNTATSVILDLPTGLVYDLVVTTYDTEGRESRPSEAVNVALDHFPPKQMAKPTATVLPLQ
jgi:hypothetical protein